MSFCGTFDASKVQHLWSSISINKYLSDDKSNSNSSNGDDSKMKAYYPFDDTGQLRNHQHVPNDKNSFKA